MKVHTRIIRQKLRSRPSGPCGCCPICGALPGHQNPPTNEVWQHKHSPIREQMAEPQVKIEPRPLSERELQVISHIAEGLSNKQIGSALGVSQFTVKSHLDRISKVWGTRNRAELVAMAYRKGLIV